MTNQIINQVINDAKEILVEEVKKELKKSGGRCDVQVELRSDKSEPTPDERINAVYLGPNDEVFVHTCLDGEYENDFELRDGFTLDEIIEIIDAM